MKRLMALMLVALFFGYSLPTSYAQLAPSTSAGVSTMGDGGAGGEATQDESLGDTDTQDKEKTDEEMPFATVDPQTVDLDNLPDGAKKELLLRFGWPKDNDLYGFDSEGRAYCRAIGISGSEMRAMDDFVNYLKNNPKAWDYGINAGQDGICLDAVNVGFYKMFSQNPLLYLGGENPFGSNISFLQNFVNSGAYAMTNTPQPPTMSDIGGEGSGIVLGTIALGGTIPKGMENNPLNSAYKRHIAVFWQTPQDVASNSSGTWVAQTVGDQNWNQLISTEYLGAVYPVARADSSNITNPDGDYITSSGAKGGTMTLNRKFTVDTKNKYPTPKVYGTIPVNQILKKY